MASNPQQGPSKKPNNAPNQKPNPRNPNQNQQNTNKKSEDTNNANKQHRNPQPKNPQNHQQPKNPQNNQQNKNHQQQKNPQHKNPQNNQQHRIPQQKMNDWVILCPTPPAANFPPPPARNLAETLTPGPSHVSEANRVLKEVMSVLECPVCLEFMQAPIFMCESGHNICSQCRAKLCLPICPLCKTSVTGQRNFDLEKIASTMVTACTNSSYGCKFAGSPDEAKAHFGNCMHRQMFCPMGREFHQCTWNGSISDLQIHFAEAHQNNTRLKPGCQVLFDDFDVTKKDEDMQLVSVGKFMYLYHVKIDPAMRLAYWGIQFIGPREDASKSKYEFHIFNNKKTKKVIMSSEECQPDNLSFQDIYDSGNCVAIPLHVLKNFIHENRKFTFKFFIKPGENPKINQSNAPATAAPSRVEMRDMFCLSKKLDLL
ncbi:E3 ubiquitin-protein ligase siah-1-like isoform X2 [Arctopsyche grandis]